MYSKEIIMIQDKLHLWQFKLTDYPYLRVEEVTIEKSVGNIATSNNPKVMGSTSQTDSRITVR